MRAEKRGAAEIGSFGQDWEDVNGQCMTEGRRQPTITIGHLGNLKLKLRGKNASPLNVSWICNF